MTVLEVVPAATLRDSVLLVRSLPAFRGNDTDDLVCGRCGGTIAEGMRVQTLRRSHPEGDRLIVRCACKAFNVVVGLARGRGSGRGGGF